MTCAGWPRHPPLAANTVHYKPCPCRQCSLLFGYHRHPFSGPSPTLHCITATFVVTHCSLFWPFFRTFRSAAVHAIRALRFEFVCSEFRKLTDVCCAVWHRFALNYSWNWSEFSHDTNYCFKVCLYCLHRISIPAMHMFPDAFSRFFCIHLLFSQVFAHML